MKVRISLQNVSKILKSKVIINDISYDFERGKIYGLIGRNGSGKTMILRLLSGLILPTKGAVIYEGKKLHESIDFPTSMGLTIENTELIPQLTGYQNLIGLSKIKGLADASDVTHSLHLVGLSDTQIHQKVSEYSLGMKQKLSIAQAIFEKPNLIILDEPTNGLDDDAVERVRKLLVKLAAEGVTIILASHNKEDIELLSDEILLMQDATIHFETKKEPRDYHEI